MNEWKRCFFFFHVLKKKTALRSNEWMAYFDIWTFPGKKKTDEKKHTHTNFGEKKINYPKFEVRLVKYNIWF